ncbi:UNVERIFIED_CONTAM: hypothetical protein FKN15_021126 [Acipenser sinensis]
MGFDQNASWCRKLLCSPELLILICVIWGHAALQGSPAQCPAVSRDCNQRLGPKTPPPCVKEVEGSSNTKIEIWRSGRIEPGERLRLSCSFSGQDRIAQINWVRVRGSNATVLAVYHPLFGSSVSGDDSSVSLQGDSESQVTLTIRGPDRDQNQSVLYCCRFITFPSGTLEGCISAEEPEEPEETSTGKARDSF